MKWGVSVDELMSRPPSALLKDVIHYYNDHQLLLLMYISNVLQLLLEASLSE